MKVFNLHILIEKGGKNMSKLYEKYLKLKMEDKDKLYLFPCGNFYIFLNEDAEKINRYAVLKITNFAQGVVKCGFPRTSLDNYLRVFQTNELPVVVVEEQEQELKKEEEKLKKMVKKLKSIDLNKTTPMMALEILEKLQKILEE